MLDRIAGWEWPSKVLFFRLPADSEELLELLRGLEVPAMAVGVVPWTLVILVTGRVLLADISALP